MDHLFLSVVDDCVSLGRRWSSAAILLILGASASCSGEAPQGNAEPITGKVASAVTTEDGLAEAYGVFKTLFTTTQPPSTVPESQKYHIGYGFHPGLSTSKLLGPNGAPAGGQALIDFNAGTVTATLTGPANTSFDLYFVKNAVGQGTVKPESFDTIHIVGTFTPVAGQPNQYSLTANIGKAPFPQFGVNFDLDLVVVTVHGQSPTSNIIAVGARTIFEKRFFREQAGTTLDPVSGTLANFVETNDPLVQRGAFLFFNETFSGNGRTCGTCHRLLDNLTIDPAFVATLPSNDPLFVFPAGLEDPNMLPHALIRENVDGFEDPTHKFVARGVPHTLSLSTSNGVVMTGIGRNNAPLTHADGPPPEQRLGWSGDGSPGRGTLIEFAFGAVVQHFTKSLNRLPGTDFRIPTQAELEALEAFQLFTGRQSSPDLGPVGFGDPAATAGQTSALGPDGQCQVCHVELRGNPGLNFDFNTGIETVPISFRTSTNMPLDGAFGVVDFDANGNPVPGTIATGFGDGQFNAPPLYDAADTAPFFHNEAFSTIEDAVAFYVSPEFQASPGANFARPTLAGNGIQNVAAFLRTINALTNIAEIRKRAIYLQNNATQGGTTIMNAMIKDTQDAINDLTTPDLSGSATANALQALTTLKLLLQNSMPFANSEPTTPMIQAEAWLQIARQDLLPTNLNNVF